MDIFDIIIILLKIGIFLIPVLMIMPFLVLMERKLAGYIQVRPGPNRVGPWGILQTLVDGLKIFIKEDFEPKMVDRPLFFLAPILAIVPTLICLSVIPFGPTITIPPEIKYIGGRKIPLSIADLSVGLIFVFAVASIGVYGIVLAGWSSNSKYSLFGGIRSSAQMISYEIGFALSVVGVLLFAESFNLREIVEKQQGGLWNWYVWKQPLGFILFITAIFAETNRLPFDLPEGEAEITGGYHTEYSSMKFAMFFMGEYIAMIVMSALGVTLFIGGWQAPVEIGVMKIWWLQAISGIFWFSVKMFFFISFFIFIRWTWPRLRFDQLLNFGWKMMFLLGLANVILTACLILLKAPTIVFFIDGLLLIIIVDYFYSKWRKRKIAKYLKLPTM